MQLNDIAMIAADTSRSRVYIQALQRHDLLPNHVLVLENTSKKLLPGELSDAQKYNKKNIAAYIDECWSEINFDPGESIKVTLEKNNIAYEKTGINDINDPVIINKIQRRPESVFIYSGYGGVLLKKEVLNVGKQFLHVHGGYLPDYKGSTTNYYSLIVENKIGASSLFLNEEIDSGSVLLRRKFPSPPDKKEMDHVYDSGARAKVLVDTLKSYINTGVWNYEYKSGLGGETYYVIHPVLKHIAILAKG